MKAPYYHYGGITIYNAEASEILPHINADLLCTDPPYGIGVARGKFGGHGRKRVLSRFIRGKRVIQPTDYGDASWDDKPVEIALLDMARRATKWQIIFGGNYYGLGPARCYLVWDKLRGETDYADAELAWTNLDRPVRVCRWRWNGFLQEDQRHKEKRLHPAQKPLAVMKWAIRQAPAECQVVLDPFMGSGSTLRAAKDLGLQAIGVEMEERYCEIAANRLSQQVLGLAASS